MMKDGGLDLIALAEVSFEAACDLRQDVCPGFEVFAIDEVSRDPNRGRPTFQVAFLYDPGIAQVDQNLHCPVDVSEPSRPMAILDYKLPADTLRVYACHFTSQIGSRSSRKNREEMARQLNREAFGFLRNDAGQPTRRHILILGDLNDEPFGMLEKELIASRDRRWVCSPHATDVPVRRARLYNCSWRLLGERLPHPSPGIRGHAAGTYYWKKKNRWHTWDHVLVSGSLLGQGFPRLDEQSVCVVSGPGLVGRTGRPDKFRFAKGKVKGLSDHLPVRGQLLLP
jgi:endonuclease/exonuclease/phosphatase family metal-dependent hydrolase